MILGGTAYSNLMKALLFQLFTVSVTHFVTSNLQFPQFILSSVFIFVYIMLTISPP